MAIGNALCDKGYEAAILASTESSNNFKRHASSVWMKIQASSWTNDASLVCAMVNCTHLMRSKLEWVRENACHGLVRLYLRGGGVGGPDVVREFTLAKAQSDENKHRVQYRELCMIASMAGMPSLVFLLFAFTASPAYWSKEEADFCTSPPVKPLKRFPTLIPHLRLGRVHPFELVSKACQCLYALLNENDLEMAKNTQEYIQVLDLAISSLESPMSRTRRSGVRLLTALLKEQNEVSLLDEYLDVLWDLTLERLDDILPSIQADAKQLVSVLRSRSIENARMPNSKGLPILLDYLLDKGIHTKFIGSRSCAMGMLVELVEKSGSVLLERAGDVVEAFLSALGSHELQEIQVLMFHTKDKGGQLKLSGQELEKMRVQIANESPLLKSVYACLHQVSKSGREDFFTNVLVRLRKLIVHGVGLPTLSCTIQVFLSLTKNPIWGHAISLNAKPLLKALGPKLLDKSILSEQAAGAIARLAAFAPLEMVEEVILTYVIPLYVDIMSSTSARLRAATTLLELSHHVSLACCLGDVFLGCEDEDVQVASLFQQAWLACGSALEHSQVLFPHCIHGLTQQSWRTRRESVLGMGKLALSSAQQEQGVEVLLNALQGHHWKGKETIFQAISGLHTNQPLRVVHAYLHACSTVNHPLVFKRLAYRHLGLHIAQNLPSAYLLLFTQVQKEVDILAVSSTPIYPLYAECIEALSTAYTQEAVPLAPHIMLLVSATMETGIPWNVILACLHVAGCLSHLVEARDVLFLGIDRARNRAKLLVASLSGLVKVNTRLSATEMGVVKGLLGHKESSVIRAAEAVLQAQKDLGVV